MTADKGKMLKGIALAIAAGICWGSMGATAQFLMRDFGFAPLDLVTLRIFTAGIVLLVLHAVTGGGNIFEPLKKNENLRDILLASATVLFAQYSFIQGIHYSNAGTAAVVITTVPLFVCVWLAFSERRPVRAVEMLCFLLATGGVVLLVTKGDFFNARFFYQRSDVGVGVRNRKRRVLHSAKGGTWSRRCDSCCRVEYGFWGLGGIAI